MFVGNIEYFYSIFMVSMVLCEKRSVLFKILIVVKATMPMFTIILSRVILNETQTLPVSLSSANTRVVMLQWSMSS